MAQTRTSLRLTEDAAAVQRTLAGDTRGFESLMRRYHAPLRRLLRAMVRNGEDAEDILQETFLRAFRFLHRYDINRPFGPWLLRIGANLARNHLRRRRARPEVSLDESQEGEGGEAFAGIWLADCATLADLDYRQLRANARRALAELPTDQRVVLEMRLLAEMSYKEISSALQIPIGTVMSRLNRGRARIQEALNEQTSEATALEEP